MDPFWTWGAILALIAIAFWPDSWSPWNKKFRQTWPDYVSWYRAPYETRIQYLAKDPEGGYFYTTDIEQAHRFLTHAEARLATPVYDGSAGIRERCGVLEVRK